MSTLSRVTHRSIQESTLASLQSNLAAMASTQEQISSGKRINKPSDDPTGTANALQLNSELANNTQYGLNAADGLAWVNTQDTALSTATSQISHALSLVTQALNTGTQSTTSRAAIGAEIDGVKSVVLGVANSQYLGRSVFAGTSTAQAFSATATTNANGTPTGYQTSQIAGTTVTRQVGPGNTVRADADGTAIFGADVDASGTATTGSSSPSVFKLLDEISSSVKDPAYTSSLGSLSSMLTQLQTRYTTITTAHTDVGARMTAMTTAQDAVTDRNVSLSASLSAVQDTDMGTAAINLQMQQTAYNAALAVTAKVSQKSLLDFIS